MTLLAQQAQRVLNAALESPHGIVIKIHTMKDMVQPAHHARQILYRFKTLSKEYQSLRIDIVGDDELWVIKLAEGA